MTTENATASTCAAPPCNVVTRYVYDRSGNRTAIIDARGTSFQDTTYRRSFAYDAADNQTKAIDPLGQVTRWEYDADNRLLWKRDPRLPAGAYDTHYAYNDLDLVTDIDADWLGASSITMRYDALGQRTSLSDALGISGFQYDPLGRLTNVGEPGGVSGNNYDVSYTYNARGQRRTLTYPGAATTLAYDYYNDGQLWTVQQGSATLATYQYDNVGRVQSLTRANLNAVTTYGYDGGDRLRDLNTVANSATASAFHYDVDRTGLRTVLNESLPSDGSITPLNVYRNWINRNKHAQEGVEPLQPREWRPYALCARARARRTSRQAVYHQRQHGAQRLGWHGHELRWRWRYCYPNCDRNTNEYTRWPYSHTDDDCQRHAHQHGDSDCNGNKYACWPHQYRDGHTHEHRDGNL